MSIFGIVFVFRHFSSCLCTLKDISKLNSQNFVQSHKLCLFSVSKVVFCFSVVGKAFAVATAIVFGGSTLVFGLAVSRLQVQNVRTSMLCVDSSIFLF